MGFRASIPESLQTKDNAYFGASYFEKSDPLSLRILTKEKIPEEKPVPERKPELIDPFQKTPDPPKPDISKAHAKNEDATPNEFGAVFDTPDIQRSDSFDDLEIDVKKTGKQRLRKMYEKMVGLRQRAHVSEDRNLEYADITSSDSIGQKKKNRRKKKSGKKRKIKRKGPKAPKNKNYSEEIVEESHSSKEERSSKEDSSDKISSGQTPSEQSDRDKEDKRKEGSSSDEENSNKVSSNEASSRQTPSEQSNRDKEDESQEGSSEEKMNSSNDIYSKHPENPYGPSQSRGALKLPYIQTLKQDEFYHRQRLDIIFHLIFRENKRSPVLQKQLRKAIKALKIEGVISDDIPHKAPNPFDLAHYALRSRRVLSILCAPHFQLLLEWLSDHPNPTKVNLSTIFFEFQDEFMELANMGVLDYLFEKDFRSTVNHPEVLALAFDLDFLKDLMRYSHNAFARDQLGDNLDFQHKLYVLKKHHLDCDSFNLVLHQIHPMAYRALFPKSHIILVSVIQKISVVPI